MSGLRASACTALLVLWGGAVGADDPRAPEPTASTEPARKLCDSLAANDFGAVSRAIGGSPSLAVTPDPEGRLPLVVASACEKWASGRSVALLLEKGADPNRADREGRRPIDVVSDAEKLRMLLDAGARPAKDTFRNWLRRVVPREPDRAMMTLFLEHGADARGILAGLIRTVNEEEDREERCPFLVDTLLELQPALGREAPSGEASLLHLAVKSRRRQCVVALLRHEGVPRDVRDAKGRIPLHWAALTQQRELVGAATPAQLNARDHDGRTAAHVALEAGNDATLEWLVSSGARIDVADRGGRTLLHLAATTGNGRAVDFLLGRHADKEVRDASGRRPADVAAWTVAERLADAPYRRPVPPAVPGEPEAHTLVRRGDYGRLESLFHKLPAAATEETDREGATALHLAVRLGDVQAVWTLRRSAGARASARDRLGRTPLHEAARLDRKNIVLILLRFAADPGIRDASQRTPADLGSDETRYLIESFPAAEARRNYPLETAVERGEIDTVRRLWGDGLTGPRGVSLLETAVNEEQAEMAEMLIAGGVPAQTALQGAVARRQLAMVELLLAQGASPRPARAPSPLFHVWDNRVANALIDHGADVDAVDESGASALHRAVRQNLLGVATALLENVANANARDATGRTSLFYARDASWVGLLRRGGADMRARDGAGRTPLFCMKQNEPDRTPMPDTALAQALLSAGVDPRATDNEGLTALHTAAAIWGSAPVVKVLVAAGANPNATDRIGRTPLDFVGDDPGGGTRRALLEAGAREGSGKRLAEEQARQRAADERHERRRRVAAIPAFRAFRYLQLGAYLAILVAGVIWVLVASRRRA